MGCRGRNRDDWRALEIFLTVRISDISRARMVVVVVVVFLGGKVSL